MSSGGSGVCKRAAAIATDIDDKRRAEETLARLGSIARMIGVDKTLGDPNSFGASIVFALPFVVALWRNGLGGRWGRYALVGYTGLSGLCILLTGSRSSLLGLVLWVALLVFRGRNRLAWMTAVALGAPAVFVALPFLMGAAGNLIGGFLSDRLSRRYGLSVGRRVLGSVCLAVSAGMLLATALTTGKVSGVVFLALGFGDVSVVIPLAGTAPLFVLLIAYLFPSQSNRLNWRVIAGATLIVLGVVLLSR